MFFVALAIDYDGTLARDGRVDQPTLEALQRIKASGRQLILVTGRDLPGLQRVFDGLPLFDLVVAENGGVLFNPATKNETPLAEPPPRDFVARLEELGVAPLTVGRTIVATWEPNETTVLQAIRERGLELHIVFNKGAVMVLPSNVNKASGLQHALKALSLSAHNVVGIGDAENDEAFLAACGCAVAVNNAVPAVKSRADLIVADHGAGVIELADLLTRTDLRTTGLSLPRRQPTLGLRSDGSRLCLTPFETVLITGSSGSGKSTVVTSLLEQIREFAFEFCVIDPEGDYAELPDAVVIGTGKQEPQLGMVWPLLAAPDVGIVINMLAISPTERPQFLASFLPEFSRLRAATGRPHWLVIDEVHHCLPAQWDHAPATLPQELRGTIAVTVHPEEVATSFLELVSTVVGVGPGSLAAIDRFCRATDRSWSHAETAALGTDQVHVLTRDGALETVTVPKPKQKQQRHVRKY